MLEIQVVSDQIDVHPVLNALEKVDVLITCAKTPETISEWRFHIKRCPIDGEVIEVLLPNNSKMLEDMDIRFELLDDDTVDNTTGLQNFSIRLIDVQANMTGTVIECGARMSGTTQRQFHDNATVLIVYTQEGEIVFKPGNWLE